ncbi:hypothetical protein BJ138DRAFT_127285 [Hygrophoropsis aurantiaca]|uniref:Uncharacterized protein n=1 Tax=Hygrophoropsis aurantiaca TaxID=72124 RepID=A0ACB8AAJ2_9AGAM|nr:hypothetical protein BJ138DRAFT_127285 [Hygrophoropsis aurantiaca]
MSIPTTQTNTSISAILFSIFSFESTPPPYNHWRVNSVTSPPALSYANKSPTQHCSCAHSEVFISLGPSGAIPMPNSVAYDGALKQERRRTQSIALREMENPDSFCESGERKDGSEHMDGLLPAQGLHRVSISHPSHHGPRLRTMSAPKGLVAAPVLSNGAGDNIELSQLKTSTDEISGSRFGSSAHTKKSSSGLTRRSASCS